MSRVFTYVKISESLAIAFFIYVAGYIRQMTHSFSGVSLLMVACGGVAMAATLALMQETKAVGE